MWYVCSSLSGRDSGRLSSHRDRAEVPRAEFSKTGAKVNCNNGQERKRAAQRGRQLASQRLKTGKASRKKAGLRTWLPWRPVQDAQHKGNPIGYWSQRGLTGLWRMERELKISHQLPSDSTPNLLFVPENKSTSFLIPWRKERVGREKEGRKREGEGLRMDTS